jgi:hypothetical protein
MMDELPKNKGMIREFLDFLKVRKKWWLLPVIVLLLIIGALIIFGQSSALSPLIYALG